uniref:Uncharacterized protein n=1 Tax=Romanomermis culicivorax TaxID=13658 RepID=A0A915I415_ROMCU
MQLQDSVQTPDCVTRRSLKLNKEKLLLDGPECLLTRQDNINVENACHLKLHQLDDNEAKSVSIILENDSREQPIFICYKPLDEDDKFYIKKLKLDVQNLELMLNAGIVTFVSTCIHVTIPTMQYHHML